MRKVGVEVSSMQIQFRLHHTSPLYQWIKQLEDSGENVSEAIRSRLLSQLAQDVNSTYYPNYLVHMKNSENWILAQRVMPTTHRDLMMDAIEKHRGGLDMTITR